MVIQEITTLCNFFFFNLGGDQQWNRLPREVLGFLSMGILKILLETALSKISYMILHRAGD